MWEKVLRLGSIVYYYGTAELGSPHELGLKETLYLLSILLVRGVRVKQNLNYEQNDFY